MAVTAVEPFKREMNEATVSEWMQTLDTSKWELICSEEHKHGYKVSICFSNDDDEYQISFSYLMNPLNGTRGELRCTITDLGKDLELEVFEGDAAERLFELAPKEKSGEEMLTMPEVVI